MMNRSLIASLALAAAVFVSTTRADAVDDYVRSQMTSQHIPGVALGVVKNGKPIKVQGYGFANLEHEIPVRADTVFRIGSVSKQIIATAIMLLINDGKVSLEDKAAKYFEGAPAAWNDITIRHLLTHTAGLVREGPGFNPLKAQSDAELVKSAYATPLVFKTGEKWQYSNLGYFMLAEIIAKVSGKPWPQFVEERVFSPLTMTASGIVDINPIVPHRAEGYVYSNNEYRHAATLLALRPSGAFMSSLNDMLKWNASHDAASLLSQSALNAMWAPVTLVDGTPYPYGFGFQLDTLGTHRAVGHGGSLTGFRSWYLRLPEDKLSIIVLTNNETAPTDAIAAGVALRYVKDLIPNRQAARLSPAEIDAVTGSYRLPNGSVWTLTREGKRLKFNSPATRSETLMAPNSATLFFSESDPRFHVVFDKTGPVMRATTYFNGREERVGTKE